MLSQDIKSIIRALDAVSWETGRYEASSERGKPLF